MVSNDAGPPMDHTHEVHGSVESSRRGRMNIMKL